LIEDEINNVNDNPISWPGDDSTEPGVVHGGNFQGQQIGFASDAINTALVQIAILAERQLDVIASPEFNGGAPLLCAETPGRDAGMAGAQITCTALTAEIRAHGQMHANASMPTNGRNQDVVSMGTMASRMAFGQTDRVAGVLAILGVGAAQLTALRARGRAEGRLTPVLELFEGYEPFTHDRALYEDVRAMSERVLARETV
jgi:histidine ammonia-lyase/tyrosine ammonia-lyase